MSRLGRLTRLLAPGFILLALAGSRPALAQGLDFLQRLGPGTGLNRAVRLAATHDGSSVFVLNDYLDGAEFAPFNSVARFSSASDEALQFAEVLYGGTGPLRGLRKLASLAISPDDRFLFVGAARQDFVRQGFVEESPAIATLAIGPDGALEYRSLVEMHLPGLPLSLVVSPDGNHLYALVSEPNFGPVALVAFEHDRQTGRLRLIQDVELGDLLQIPDFSALAFDLSASPDGRHLYVRTHAVDLAEKILTLDRQADSGQITAARGLSAESIVQELGSITSLSISGDGAHVYATIDEKSPSPAGGDPRLLSFHRDPATGDLQAPQVLTVPPPANGLDRYLIVSPDDRHAYECLDQDTLLAYRVDLDAGHLEPIQTLDVSSVDGQSTGCGLPLVSGDGRFLQLSDPFGSPQGFLTRLRRDASTGTVVPVNALVEGEDGLLSVAHLHRSVVSPDGREVYAVREGWQILTFRRDAGASGRLETPPEATLQLPTTADPRETDAALAVTPDGRHLYVGFADERFTLARDPATGALRQIDRSTPGALALAVSADGRHVYAKTSPSTVTAYERNLRSGALTAVHEVELPTHGPTVPEGFALSPDERNLYVGTGGDFGGGTGQGALTVLRLDPASGKLEVADEMTIEERNGEAPQLRAVKVTPDGRHLYLALWFQTFPFGTRELRLFDRSPADGALTADRLVGAGRSFALAPNGRTLYTLDRRQLDEPAKITALLVDPASGDLTTQGALPGTDKGNFETATVSPDGANVYVSAYDGLSVFANRWFESGEIPGFRFQVSIDPGTGRALRGERVDRCPAGTACAQGAVPGRTEALLRIVGPKPNGRLWPTLVKFSTSPIDVLIDQLASGEIKSYHLAGATPGSGELPGLFDRDGFAPTPGASGVRWIEPGPDPARSHETAGEPPPPPPSAPVFTSDAFPDFRFQVRLTDGTGEDLPLRKEADCFEETLCVSGAVPGRSELFLRIVGPKPNGRLWPTLVRTTTSTAEIWIEQMSTGQVNYYRLEGATPGSSDLTGLFDREGFAP